MRSVTHYLIAERLFSYEMNESEFRKRIAAGPSTTAHEYAVVVRGVRSAVIIPAKCLHGGSEGELRESVRVDGRSLDESRHKLRRLMKSLLPKNSAEIYVLGELYAKAPRLIYNCVPFARLVVCALSWYLFSFSGRRVCAACT